MTLMFRHIKKLKEAVKAKLVNNNANDAVVVSHTRLLVCAVAIVLLYSLLIIRLFELSLSEYQQAQSANFSSEHMVQRANIVDRNGIILATNLTTASLYANPQKLTKPNQVAQMLATIFDEIDQKALAEKLADKTKSFVWIVRHLSPKQQQIVHDLAIPGLDFMAEEKRVYPHGALFSHLLGFVDLDGNGLAGVERKFNNALIGKNDAISLSIDARVQQVLREELAYQISQHSAIGGSAIIMDVNTAEVLGMVSLPDFDPNHPTSYPQKNLFNQATLGAYEMGSTFKILTTAMGIDGGFVNINDAFNTNAEIMVGSHRISDYRGKGGFLSVPEILMYSSNIGTAQIAMKAGAVHQKQFLKTFGMLQETSIELPEKARPLFPSNWGASSMITISYGHGVATTPLHSVSAMAAIVNGGHLIPATILKVDEKSKLQTKQILASDTSSTMRKLLRLVAQAGFAKKANVEGYAVGGKTGTAEKIVNGRYSKTANFASFLGAFPMHKPKIAIFIAIDEARPNSINMGFTTGGMVAAPVAAKVIEKIAPILNVEPINEDEESQLLALQYQARYTKQQ